MDESQMHHAEAKNSVKRLSAVWLHLYDTLETTNKTQIGGGEGLRAGEGFIKDHEDIFEDDENVQYLDCGGAYTISVFVKTHRSVH